MKKPKYEIGQQVWWATFLTEETSMECPDCGGSGQLLVTFYDKTTVSIGCSRCGQGYTPPTGRVKTYNRHAKAEIVVIDGLEIKTDGTIEYHTSSSYIVREKYLFNTETRARRCAQELAADHSRRELEEIQKKEENTKSWAWNASYHRREIKNHMESIAYHEAKLSVASLKAKL